MEIPAGGIEPGENVETAVRREIQEETDEIKVVRVPTVEMPALLSSGKITDAKNIAGL